MGTQESDSQEGGHASGRLFTLADAAVAIAQAPTPADALRVLTDHARALIGAHQAITSMVAEDGVQTVRAVSYSDKYGVVNVEEATALPWAGELRSTASFTDAELQADEQRRACRIPGAPPFRGLLAAPLFGRGGGQIGMLLLSDRCEGDFDARDEAALVQLAQLGSVLLENVGLMEQAQLARADAEYANRAKSDFLATMSHEIRTPINAVLGYTELLEIGISGPLNTVQREHLGRIRTSSLHLLRLVEEVLDLAKVEAGRLELELGSYRLVDAVDLALALVRPQAEERGVILEDHCSTRDELQYYGDQNRVRQILANLLVNAVKFTESGGTVTLSCDVQSTPPGLRLPSGGWLAVSVADTGMGVSRELQQRIFEPFERGEQGHTRRHGGSGLGLSISRRLARAMGGDVTLVSKPGAGATFTLWLPTPSSDTQDSAPATASQLAEQYAQLPDDLLQRASAHLVANTPPILSEFVRNLRDEPLFNVVRSMPDAIIADHLGTFIGDMASCLQALHYGLNSAVPLLRDGTRIQRLLAERHGEQRAQLGMFEDAIRREYAVLARIIDRHLRKGMAPHATPSQLDDLTALVIGMVQAAEYTSTLAVRRAAMR